ncbi:dynein light chain type 1 domain-containing protein [Ditylenchus destructor]|uniref:Dynein light chain type 1 domain-containing protein n=1 Tax=Ditylenchus destructor TaxID=166010 RepID=A0AAD4MNR9_9BILA|nr:dynein light chain type 1 domain-containing protein [Ditylenchus destructor]
MGRFGSGRVIRQSLRLGETRRLVPVSPTKIDSAGIYGFRKILDDQGRRQAAKPRGQSYGICILFPLRDTMDNSPKLDSRMSDALDDSANLEQAIRKINENGNKMDKLSYQICSTSSPFSFEKNISEMHKYLEKLDQSHSILSTPDTGICPKEVSVRDKTPNVQSQDALLEFERLRQEFKQQIDALRQELMSKNEAKMSDGMNELRAVFGTINWSGDESSSKIGSFIEESENRQLAECRDIIENTPVLRGGLAGKTKRGLRENTEKDLSDNVINLSEDLSTLEASVEHCNAFAKTRDKPEAGSEPSKSTAHNLDLTLKRQETEKQSEGRQIVSLQMNGSSVEELRGEKAMLSHRNRAKDEFDQRIYPLVDLLFCLFVLFVFIYAFSELKLARENLNGLTHYKASTEREIQDLKKSLDAEIKQRSETESELKLAQDNLEELRHDKASTQKNIKDLRNSLDVEIKERRKAESELKVAYENSKNLSNDKASTQREIEDLRNSLKLAQQNLEELRGKKDKAENALKRVSWLLPMLMIIFLLVLTFLISTQSSKEAKDSLARSDVVIVKSEMSTEMQNHAIELMLASMKECTASDISKFISRKMKEKYGSEWICSISDRMPSPIVLDNQHLVSWLLPMLMIIFLLVLTFLIATKSSKEAKEPFARSDVVIVKSEMSTEMQNYAIDLMLESMKECTASDISKFISRKMKEKYGSEWICSISDRMPSPIVLDNQHFLRAGLKLDDIYIELISLPQFDTQNGHN